MDAAFRYLKWNDDVVGLVAPDLSVRFAEPRFNTTVGLYTHGQTSWTPDQFLQFLSERIMSPARRDIERLLFRCGLSEYDVFKIADATRAINPATSCGWPRPPMLPWPRRPRRSSTPSSCSAPMRRETASIRRRVRT